MQKELLTVEFRYNDKLENRFTTKTITIGCYDSLEQAIDKGNEVLSSIISKKFEVRSNDKFKLKDTFGIPMRLVTNCCYPTNANGIQYFAKITQLKYDSLNDTINEVFDRRNVYLNK